MTRGNDDQRFGATENEGLHSDDEHSANETTPLFHNENVQAANSSGVLNETSNDRRRVLRANFMKGTRRDIAYGIFFSIPIVLLVPSLIFFIITLNIRASFPPVPMQEAIAYLNHQIHQLSDSLGTCQDNTTNLVRLIHNEQHRVEECHESEKKLATRVEFAEEMLDKCHLEELDLQEQLTNVKGDLGVCVDERDDLKRQMKHGVFIQFLEMLGSLGTGGDSWVCSETTPSWSYGYVTERSPHPTIKIQSWTSDLNNKDHSHTPLVFPPPSLTSNPSESAPPNSKMPLLSKSTTRSGQVTMDRLSHTKSSNGVSGQVDNGSIRVIGYTVRSHNSSGGNGWWRITKLPAFGVRGTPIEFFALAGKWAGNTARYEVTVYYIGGDEESSTLVKPQ